MNLRHPELCVVLAVLLEIFFFFFFCVHSHLVKHVNISLVQGRCVLNWLITCVVSKSCAITHLITYCYTLGVCFGGNDLSRRSIRNFCHWKGDLSTME